MRRSRHGRGHRRFLAFHDVGALGWGGQHRTLGVRDGAMGNLITDEDRDLIARAWRLSGAAVSRARRDTPLWSTTA